MRLKFLIILLFAALGNAFAQSNSIYQIAPMAVCWRTPMNVDSNLVAYWLFSSRETTPKVVSYLTASGTAVVVAGGTVQNGFCCCSGGGQDTLGINISGDTLILTQNDITYTYAPQGDTLGIQINGDTLILTQGDSTYVFLGGGGGGGTWLKPELEAADVTIFSNLNSLFLTDDDEEQTNQISNSLISIQNADTGEGVTITVDDIEAQAALSIRADQNLSFSSTTGNVGIQSETGVIDIYANDDLYLSTDNGEINLYSVDALRMATESADWYVDIEGGATLNINQGDLEFTVDGTMNMQSINSGVGIYGQSIDIGSDEGLFYAYGQSFAIESEEQLYMLAEDSLYLWTESFVRTNNGSLFFKERVPSTATGFDVELPSNQPLDNSFVRYQASGESEWVVLPGPIYGQLYFNNFSAFADSIVLPTLVASPGIGNYVVEFPSGLAQGITRTDSSFVVAASTFYEFTYTVTYWQDGPVGANFGAYVDVDGGFLPLSINQQTKPTDVANITAIQTLSHSCILNINTVTPARLGLFGSDGVTVLNAVFTIRQL